MKISGFGGIALSGMLLLPTFGAVAADPYSIYKSYKRYQDPIARAAAIEKLRNAKAAAQEKLQAGMAYAGEKGAAALAYAQEKAASFKQWAAHNKGKIIAATAALVAIAVTLGTVEHGRQAYRQQILQKFSDHGVDLSDKAVRDYCYTMGAIVNSKDAKAFRKIFTNAAQSRLYEEFKANTPGFAEAMRDLGSVSRHRPILGAEAQATYAEHGTYVKQNPWYRP